LKKRLRILKRINIDKPIEIVLGNSGVTANTASLKGFLEEQEQENQLFNERLQAIRGQVEDLGDALSDGNLIETGRIMNQNHKILIEMELHFKS
jgi:mevalonate kinase